ncbi:ATP-binding protein [Bacteroides sp.]
MKRHILLLFLTTLFFHISIYEIQAHNTYKISSKEGLSNSSVLSLYQDKDGYLWAGTCDGLNILDGNDIEIYYPNEELSNSISGNLIEAVSELTDGQFWIRTNYGLDLFDKYQKNIKCYTQFEGSYKYSHNKLQETLVLYNDNNFYFYNKEQQKFDLAGPLPVNYKEVMDFFIDDTNKIWICTPDKVINATLKDGKIADEERNPLFNDDTYTRYLFHEKDKLYFVDESYTFYEFDITNKIKKHIINLKVPIQEYGNISTIIKDKDDYLIGFLTNGLIRVKYTPENASKYILEETTIHCGVFSLMKDLYQNIIWIGTDGQGIYRYSNDSYTFHSITYDQFPIQISKPIRSLYLDSKQNLWIGTKGDGVIRIEDFHPGQDIRTKKVSQYTLHNSSLADNSVYTFFPSKKNILWMGSDGDKLNYYSYIDNKIHEVSIPDNISIRNVHVLYETNDTTLWIATAGQGILKATLNNDSNRPKILTIKPIQLGKELTHTHFFSMYQENDSILWFGSRGNGVVRLNLLTFKYDNYLLHKKKTSPVNDIFCMYRDNRHIYLGTSSGLIETKFMKTELQTRNATREFHFSNNTIHGILSTAPDESLWLSTNGGLIKYDYDNQNAEVYNQQNGLDVIEFSDGAYFKDDEKNDLYFGGINGFVVVHKEEIENQVYTPPVLFKNIRINEQNINIKNLIKDEVLTLTSKQNFFTISFSVSDYINRNNHTYFYQLQGFNNNWFNNYNSNKIVITNLPPGEYTLLTKYQCGPTQSDIYSLKIKILAPWYATPWAYICYFLIATLTCSYIIYTAIRKQHKKRKNQLVRLQQKQKEEIYESKLRFFTNITHELCTPLTLIAGPCQRVLTYPKSDSFILKYTELIQRNAQRLNELLQELIEFRRIDTQHRQCIIEDTAVSELGKDIFNSFAELADSRNIHYQMSVTDNITWPTDRNAITTIVTNLISNAFKYTPNGGDISVSINTDNGSLQLRVNNSGPGIQPENIHLIFDRYRILDRFEKQSVQGGATRNGLGLAICKSLVELLNGNIHVESTPDVSTTFLVELPQMPITPQSNTSAISREVEITSKTVDFTLSPKEYEYKESRLSIFIIDDDTEMLWFISELFADKYNVIPLSDASQALRKLETRHPDIVISDIFMTPIDGITFTKKIKENKQTSHIPVILLSASQDVKEQIKGMESGADIYLNKPFNVEYLKTVVDNLIKRNHSLKDYYESTLSTFNLTNGKLLHSSDQEFLNKMLQIIDENIMNPEISTQFVADAMGLSTRNLYRKLEGITEMTPANIIKEYRLNMAQKLLVKTKLSIDEIIYKSGFTNRGTFFKLFSSKYGYTPKAYREQKISEVSLETETETDTLL